MPSHVVIPVTDLSVVGEARRAAVALAGRAGLDETDRGRVAIVATELATNLVRHAREGQLLLNVIAETGGTPTVEVLSVDAGPGMADVDRCLRDGFSTAGTAGNGLGAVRRLSAEFDLYSAPSGTVVLSRITPAAGGSEAPPPRKAHRWGVIAIPKPGETVCGDAWRVASHAAGVSVLVADGLGHGPAAAEASEGAGRVLDEDPARDPKAVLETVHRAIAGTRGAAVAVARVEPDARKLRYAAVGNIAGSLLHAGASRGLFSHNGTVGHQVRKVQEFEYPWLPGSVAVLYSDGLQSRWDLRKYPGLPARHPAVIAGVLVRDFKRGRDDVTVAVLSFPE